VDVLAFVGIVAGYLWIVLPATGGRPAWNSSFTVAAVALAAFFTWRKRIPLQRAGLRIDNLAAVAGWYGAAAVLYAGGVLALYRDSLRPLPEAWPGAAKVGGLLLWALLQQFCLLSFMLNRMRAILGRDLPAALTTAILFSLLHLPNPFLTLYTLGGGLILALVFLRRPSLPAAALAHAAASFAAGRLLTPQTTGWMRVGPLYMWKH
jgi:membrane protease YdiL (CAAX protease family)